jgi:alpha-L-arabinofuranosidase
MGHPEPFTLEYMAIGNEDCGKKYYTGLFLSFFLTFLDIFYFLLSNQNSNLLQYLRTTNLLSNTSTFNTVYLGFFILLANLSRARVLP